MRQAELEIADAVTKSRSEFDTLPMGLVVWSLIVYGNSSTMERMIDYKEPALVYLMTELGDLLAAS
jgi:hypothetical protein